jgi:hypothetical protein
MGAYRYPFKRGHNRLFIMEGALALSVIAGLMFVTVRIMNMGLPAAWNQAAETVSDLVKAETHATPADIKSP